MSLTYSPPKAHEFVPFFGPGSITTQPQRRRYLRLIFVGSLFELWLVSGALFIYPLATSPVNAEVSVAPPHCTCPSKSHLYLFWSVYYFSALLHILRTRFQSRCQSVLHLGHSISSSGDLFGLLVAGHLVHQQTISLHLEGGRYPFIRAFPDSAVYFHGRLCSSFMFYHSQPGPATSGCLNANSPDCSG